MSSLINKDVQAWPDTLLQVVGLTTRLDTSAGSFNAVDEVSFSIEAGDTLGLVGESGCGKSMTALSIMRLVPQPPASIVGGQILWRGTDLLGFDEHQMREIRGAHISMVFQEPMTSLDPVFAIGKQLSEAILAHQEIGQKKALRLAEEMLEQVQIPSAHSRLNSYPHQLSGGMRQRVMIAMSLSLKPDLLIADEPTTALDVTIEAQILDLIRELQADIGMSLLLITHNLGLVADICSRTAIMYAGQVVEIGPTALLLEGPSHPYTHALLRSIPRLDQEREYLPTIAGRPPRLYRAKECRFGPRCERADRQCQCEAPPWVSLTPRHGVRCWHPLAES
jgi:oligopeptide/dipeptide ABC transporter ATP-binding protein